MLLDSSQSSEGPARKLVREDAALQIPDDVYSGEQAGSREVGRGADSTDAGFPDLISEESAWDLEESYDVQPRDINANLEWLQQQRTCRGASAVVLTSAATGQGLHKLMLAINAMLERRQGSVDTEHRAAAEGSLPDRGRPSSEAQVVGHQQGRDSMASRAA